MKQKKLINKKINLWKKVTKTINKMQKNVK